MQLISATRHSYKKGEQHHRPAARSRSISDMVSLSIDVSMYVAGRKIVVSISTSGRPGRIASMRFFNARGDVQRVAPGEFLDDQQQARTVVDDAVADHGLMADDHVGDVLQLNRLAVLHCDDDFGKLIGRHLVGRVQ